MASGPSQQEKVKVREQIERVRNDLLQHFPKILQTTRDAGVTAGGAGAGGAGAFAALYFAGINGLSAVGITSGLATIGGIVGGGMVAGIGVLALPVAAGGLAGLALVSRRQRAKLTTALNRAIQELYNIQEQLVANAEYFEGELAVVKEYIDHLERQKPEKRPGRLRMLTRRK